MVSRGGSPLDAGNFTCCPQIQKLADHSGAAPDPAGELAALPQTFNDGRGLPSLPKNPAPTLGPSGLVSTGLRV